MFFFFFLITATAASMMTFHAYCRRLQQCMDCEKVVNLQLCFRMCFTTELCFCGANCGCHPAVRSAPRPIFKNVLTLSFFINMTMFNGAFVIQPIRNAE